MPPRYPTRFKPVDSFEENGYRFDAFAFVGHGGQWAGHVTVRPIGQQRVVRRWVVKGEHLTVSEFVLEARASVREQMAAGALQPPP